MKVVKFKQKNTYKGTDGKERHYYGFALVSDNGQQIPVKCFNREDYARLDMIAEYVSSKQDK